jgi:hypothetical protein
VSSAGKVEVLGRVLFSENDQFSKHLSNWPENRLYHLPLNIKSWYNIGVVKNKMKEKQKERKL